MEWETPREEKKVTINCSHMKLVGTVHCIPGTRVSDLLNKKDTIFIPVTDAQVHKVEIDGYRTEFNCAFITLNKYNIISVEETERS